LEIVGIVIAIIGALFVLFHARIRQLPTGVAVGWALCTFLLLIVVLPIYLLIHGREPRRGNEEA
jgi:ABC-type amino acid transport system permease subunit